jgi:outer membrane protein TolC
VRLASALLLLLLLAPGVKAQISLSTAVDLAEKSSPNVRAAVADVRKAIAALSESKDVYIPNFVLGASPGYAYGFPLGYPSLFQANSQSLAISFSQPDYIRAARVGVNAANLSLQDTQQQVALEVALDYVELDHDLSEIAALDEEKSWADGLVQIEQQRVIAGVDPRTAELRAELTAAQVDAKRIHLQDDAADMQQKLAHLTGLPAEGLATVSSSVPPSPSFAASAGQDDSAIRNNPGVAAAYANAKSKFYVSFGDARQNYRPLITFGAQYSLFEKFANYTQYFPRNFQYNNAAIGVVIQLPLFDAGHRAKARESAADAAHAQADADQAHNVLSERVMAMRRTTVELGAQQRVAQLESDLAHEQLATVESELANGSGGANAHPVTPREAQQAHIEERERYADSLDANFSLMKVELNLLRTTGQILDWVRSSVH